MRAAQLKKRPGHLQNFTGLSVGKFEELVAALRAEVGSGEGANRPRRRAVEGGRKTKVGLEEQLIATLMYGRLYLTQVLLGYLFDVDDSNVSHIVTKLRPLLPGVLPAHVSGLSDAHLHLLGRATGRELSAVRNVALALGRMGGHMNRPSDGLPGWQSLWAGRRRLLTPLEGAASARATATSGV